MTQQEIEKLIHALTDADEQVKYLYSNLTPRKQDRTKHTTLNCKNRLKESLEIIKKYKS